jgi:hypothetical protein
MIDNPSSNGHPHKLDMAEAPPPHKEAAAAEVGPDSSAGNSSTNDLAPHSTCTATFAEAASCSAVDKREDCASLHKPCKLVASQASKSRPTIQRYFCGLCLAGLTARALLLNVVVGNHGGPPHPQGDHVRSPRNDAQRYPRRG